MKVKAICCSSGNLRSQFLAPLNLNTPSKSTLFSVIQEIPSDVSHRQAVIKIISNRHNQLCSFILNRLSVLKQFTIKNTFPFSTTRPLINKLYLPSWFLTFALRFSATNTFFLGRHDFTSLTSAPECFS